MTGANKALIEGNQRWGLDVKVDGIANQTVENKPPAEGGGLVRILSLGCSLHCFYLWDTPCTAPRWLDGECVICLSRL